MKRMKFILLILFVFLIFDCDTESSAGTPVIKRFEILGNATGSILEQEVFTVDDTIFFQFTADDSDLDIKQAVLIQKSDTITIDPLYINLPKQITTSQAYNGNVKAETAGNWNISFYLIDEKGNKSNTVSKNITINSYETYSVTYIWGTDDFIEKHQDKMTRYNGIPVVDNKKYREGQYVNLLGYENIIINSRGYMNSWGFSFDGEPISHGFNMPAHDVILYAIWPEELIIYGGPKPFDPTDYLDPYVPDFLTGTWVTDRWAYLNPTQSSQSQIGVIVFSETTAISWVQRLDGSKLTSETLHYIEYNVDNSYLYGVSEHESYTIYGRVTFVSGQYRFFRGYHNLIEYYKVD